MGGHRHGSHTMAGVGHNHSFPHMSNLSYPEDRISSTSYRVQPRTTAVYRAGRLELELFSMLCSHEIFTDQSYHACIRSEKNPSIRSDACMTADYARGQPASAWPLAGQPCKVDCDLHTIARTHNRPFDCSPIGTQGPDRAAVEWSIMCTPIMHSTPSKLMPKWHFFL